MARALLLTLISLFLTFCSVTDSMGGSITYNIQAYPEYQAGSELSGTITTDGKLGVLTNSDIIAWNYTLIAPYYEYIPPDYESGTGANVVAIGLVASPTELTLSIPSSGSNQFYLAPAGPPSLGIDYIQSTGLDVYSGVVRVPNSAGRSGTMKRAPRS